MTVKFTAAAQTSTILVTHALGVSAEGYSIPISSEDGTVTVVTGFSQRETGPVSGWPAAIEWCSAQTQEKSR